MAKTKHVSSAIAIAVIAGLLVVAVIATITLATFAFTRKATTTLKFADNVTLEVSGINSSHVWLAESESEGSIVNEATITPPHFSEIGVKVTSGPGTNVEVFVRIFAIVYTTYANGSTPLSFTAGSGVTTAGALTEQETALKNAVPSGAKSTFICGTMRFTSTTSTFTKVINEYSPFGELTEGHLGAKTCAMVVITAKNHDTSAPALTINDWNTVLSTADYPTWPA